MTGFNMADSSRANDDYARRGDAATSSARGEKTAHPARRLRPSLWPTLAVAALVPLFVAAGHWQWNKAAAKAEIQQQRDARQGAAAIAIAAMPVDAEALRYQPVVARGRYDVGHQILIDNRIHNGQAGYHVITPLNIEGSDLRLLVNRGWIPAPAERREVPQFATPTDTVDISGTASLPSTRYFTLAPERAGAADQAQNVWQTVWQNLDLVAYARVAGFAVQPIVVELGAHSAAGGFVREWRPADDRRTTNLGYAFQWWGFAATTIVLWLVFSWRRPS